MAQTTFFFEECPTCGRHLRIRVEYLGHPLTCMHCRSVFQANQGIGTKLPDQDSLLERADRLLAQLRPVSP